MAYLTLRTIRAFAAPNHRIACATRLWKSILSELWKRTEMQHESGAFLLGNTDDPQRRILRAIYYDDLDSTAYDTGVCVVRGPAFARLWAICRANQLSVVADVHTHPGSSNQSWEDRTNPTLPNKGHISIIVPNYAKPTTLVKSLGIYEYLGSYQWKNLGHKLAHRHFYVGLCG